MSQGDIVTTYATLEMVVEIDDYFAEMLPHYVKDNA